MPPARVLALALVGLITVLLSGCSAELGRLVDRGEPPPSTAPPERSARPEAEPPPERPSANAPARASRSFGLPWSGRLEAGVQVPSSGPGHVTWDPALRRRPNRHWRRWGNARVVGAIERVIAEYRRAHPGGPRLLIGDLSRPAGGDFGPSYGLPGHASHQNGLDVDVYYPRRDRRLEPTTTPGQVDPGLAQWLVDAFLAQGAEVVFTGPSLQLRGPSGRVQRLAHHDNHLHARFGSA